MDKFWSIWAKDYLRNLPPLKGEKSNLSLKEGSVVLIEDISMPRAKWPMGVVQKVYPGRDGFVRSVDVKTSTGVFKRSVQRLRDLEIVA